MPVSTEINKNIAYSNNIFSDSDDRSVTMVNDSISVASQNPDKLDVNKLYTNYSSITSDVIPATKYFYDYVGIGLMSDPVASNVTSTTVTLTSTYTPGAYRTSFPVTIYWATIYRLKGSSAWQVSVATNTAGNTYQTNLTGLLPNAVYECKMAVGVNPNMIGSYRSESQVVTFNTLNDASYSKKYGDTSGDIISATTFTAVDASVNGYVSFRASTARIESIANTVTSPPNPTYRASCSFSNNNIYVDYSYSNYVDVVGNENFNPIVGSKFLLAMADSSVATTIVTDVTTNTVDRTNAPMKAIGVLDTLPSSASVFTYTFKNDMYALVDYAGTGTSNVYQISKITNTFTNKSFAADLDIDPTFGVKISVTDVAVFIHALRSPYLYMSKDGCNFSKIDLKQFTTRVSEIYSVSVAYLNGVYIATTGIQDIDNITFTVVDYFLNSIDDGATWTVKTASSVRNANNINPTYFASIVNFAGTLVANAVEKLDSVNPNYTIAYSKDGITWNYTSHGDRASYKYSYWLDLRVSDTYVYMISPSFADNTGSIYSYVLCSMDGITWESVKLAHKVANDDIQYVNGTFFYIDKRSYELVSLRPDFSNPNNTGNLYPEPAGELRVCDSDLYFFTTAASGLYYTYKYIKPGLVKMYSLTMQYFGTVVDLIQISETTSPKMQVNVKNNSSVINLDLTNGNILVSTLQTNLSTRYIYTYRSNWQNPAPATTISSFSLTLGADALGFKEGTVVNTFNFDIKNALALNAMYLPNEDVSTNGLFVADEYSIE